MVNALLLIIISIVSFSAVERIEEQRKYFLPSDKSLPVENFDLGDFHLHAHAIYFTEDIYFDGADHRLANSQLGLRLRRVRKGSASPTYALQVKSEMTDFNSVRIEEEEKDLGRQRLNGVFVTDVIERIIKNEKASEEDNKFLESWLENKIHSSIAPIQALRRNRISLSGLRPVVIGYSNRQRYHIIFDRSSKVSPLLLLKDSGKNRLLVPAKVKENPSWIWMMEGSWDQARFVPARGLKENEKPFWIYELEIENKYRPREMGTQLMNKFEQELKKINAKPGKESKFFRAQAHFKDK